MMSFKPGDVVGFYSQDQDTYLEGEVVSVEYFYELAIYEAYFKLPSNNGVYVKLPQDCLMRPNQPLFQVGDTVRILDPSVPADRATIARRYLSNSIWYYDVTSASVTYTALPQSWLGVVSQSGPALSEQPPKRDDRGWIVCEVCDESFEYAASEGTFTCTSCKTWSALG